MTAPTGHCGSQPLQPKTQLNGCAALAGPFASSNS